MNVVAFNGSPRKKGNTVGSINTVLVELEKEGIQTELIHVGKEKIRGCLSCYTCAKEQNEKCVVGRQSHSI